MMHLQERALNNDKYDKLKYIEAKKHLIASAKKEKKSNYKRKAWRMEE